ncbi:hypothetical protein H6G33_31805 [Calothrix sp. FACHB-1219]|nr:MULTISPECIES: hypothetical protein [unclassified Calothrix]MBD2208131.1 hypothetical protein [Calothrix sp. FACHB-168]MBD2221555.1 hypothetical protein [Calothrix sp. FACHB-1219]
MPKNSIPVRLTLTAEALWVEFFIIYTYSGLIFKFFVNKKAFRFLIYQN